MKKKSYEKKETLIICAYLFLSLELVFICILGKIKFFQYEKLTGVVTKDDIAYFLLDKQERKELYQNRNLLFKDQKKTYTIEKDQGVIMKKEDKDYYGILLTFSFPKTYKANDPIEIVLKKEKCSALDLLNKMLEGDNY